MKVDSIEIYDGKQVYLERNSSSRVDRYSLLFSICIHYEERNISYVYYFYSGENSWWVSKLPPATENKEDRYIRRPRGPNKAFINLYLPPTEVPTLAKVEVFALACILKEFDLDIFRNHNYNDERLVRLIKKDEQL